MRHLILGLVSFLFSFTAAAAAPLPDLIPIKTRTETFSHQYYVAVRDGRIWIRANPETKGLTEPGLSEVYTDQWRLLHGDGLPRVESPFWNLLGYGRPNSVVEVSADGDNLIAISERGLIYYAKFYDFKWTRNWGPPILNGSMKLPAGNLSWAMSHRGNVAGGFEDIAGNWHPVSVGVTTIYALTADGLFIKYADPWLPWQFKHDIVGPRRGRMKMVSLSASASTIFVTDAAGNMFTRLADFDSVGDDPFLKSTYEQFRHEGDDPINLPGEDWRQQPAILGRITKNITILQTGRGNAARELRVEGVDASGASGYFHKQIFAEEWSFRPTGLEVNGPFLKNGPGEMDLAETLGPKLDADYSGMTRIRGNEGEWRASVYGFNLRASPALLVLERGNQRFQTLLHTRKVSLPDQSDSWTGRAKGTFETPGSGAERFVDVKIRLEAGELVIEHDPPFFVSKLFKMKLRADCDRVLK